MVREYYLISKNFGMPFSQYKRKVMRLAREIPYTVDEVIVGKYGYYEKNRIITFRNSKGEIIERAFDCSSEPYRNILYDVYENTIGQDEIVKSTSKREFIMPRFFKKAYNEFREKYGDIGLNTLYWTNVRTKTEHLSQNINTGEKIFSVTSVDFFESIQKIFHKFIEFPSVLNRKIYNNMKKVISFETDLNGKVLTNSINEINAKYPKNDSFIMFRAFDIETLKEPITMKFLRDRKIDEIGVTVHPNYIPKNEKKGISACFMPEDGSVNFYSNYKIKSKQKLVSISRHEVEHGWQYYLDARNALREPTWQSEIYEAYGPIGNKVLKSEADKYSNSIDNYVSYDEDFQQYKQNYIEKQAERVAQNIKNKYERHGRKINQEFSHIPKEML